MSKQRYRLNVMKHPKVQTLLFHLVENHALRNTFLNQNQEFDKKKIEKFIIQQAGTGGESFTQLHHIYALSR